MAEQNFFMVLNAETNYTRYRHGTREAAIAEAERLAQQNPGHRFYVLAAFGVAEVPKPPSVFQKLEVDLDSLIPF